MKRFITCVILTIFSFFLTFSYNYVYAEENDNSVYLGGQTAGFSITTKGAYIVGLCDVITESGIKQPSVDAKLDKGDVIISIDGVDVNNATDIEKVVKDNNKKVLTIKRCGEIKIVDIVPAKDVCGKFKLGIFVREDVCGVGTITYLKGNKFASLGHPILDENEEILQISSGKIYNCNIIGYVKGERGKPGELRGVFEKKNQIGEIKLNCSCGVFGELNKNFDKKDLKKIDIGTAKVGNASIFSTVNGNESNEYSISIVKVDEIAEFKNFIIKITDTRLLNGTGGIVQGMSGSPIVQNGKLVGAVTHVFLNDPSRGFGITINKMMCS